MAAALHPLSPTAAQAARTERHWRRNYPTHFRALVQGALSSSEQALASARAGLAQARESLVWVDGGGERPLQSAMQASHSLLSLRLQGEGDARPAAWGLPRHGSLLQGQALVDQLGRWQEAGVIEPSAAAALARCAEHPEWFDLSDRHLALLGAGSEAGPLRWLARWRANLVAVDIDRPAVWQRIAGIVREGNATLRAPLREGSGEGWDRAGADLLTDTPAIAQWLIAQGQPLDIASLAYLDGEKHLRVSLAMDLIAQTVIDAQPSCSLAYLATPTDVFAVPPEAVAMAQQRMQDRPLLSRGLQQGLRLATGDRFFQPQYEGLAHGYGVSDCLVIEQGPNYALAKRLQQWRAMDARARGLSVSLNVAPSTTTASVVKNPALAAGFAGADPFGIEVFEPETTNALMAALWVHDLRAAQSKANPAHPLQHPFELFIDQACHGGLWRSPYLARSALPFAAALGWVRQRF